VSKHGSVFENAPVKMAHPENGKLPKSLYILTKAINYQSIIGKENQVEMI